MTGQTGPRRDEDVLAARYWLTEKGVAATDDIRAAESALEATADRQDCLECGGEGFRTQIRGMGMNAAEFDMTCTVCGGTGIAEVP